MAGYVRTRVRRREDPALLRGETPFMGDLRLPGLLTVAFLRSPHAHARLVDVDAADARALPGVRAVVTGADLARSTRATASPRSVSISSGTSSRNSPTP